MPSLYLFRLNSGDTTRPKTSAKASQFIEFTQHGDTNTGGAYLVSYRAELSRTPTENPAPRLEESRRPDTGWKGIKLYFTVVFQSVRGTTRTTGTDFAKLVGWYKESSDLRGSFRNGRFGIKNQFGPEFDLIPSNASGYKLTNLDFDDNIGYGIKKAVITLEHSGDASEIGETVV